MRLSNYSLNYAASIASGQFDIFRFLQLCRELGLDGASLHLTNLASVDPLYLHRVRRAYLDAGLSVAMVTVTTDFGRVPDGPEAELAKTAQAVEVARVLGAPLVRVFAGQPTSEDLRSASFERAGRLIRRACAAAAEHGIPLGLQNHNHGALCRTGQELLDMVRLVGHDNLTVVMDTGQFAGSPGASGAEAPGIEGADYLESLRMVAPLARHVRVKFYSPAADGSEPALGYDAIFGILSSVHYSGFLDIVYEPQRAVPTGEPIDRALPRVADYLRRQIRLGDVLAQADASSAIAASAMAGAGPYADLDNLPYFADEAVTVETPVAFLEGPAVDRQGRVYFTNTTLEQILRWDPQAKQLTRFRENSGRANGLRFDQQGRLVACEGGAGRVTRTDLRTGVRTVIADAYRGEPLGAPNDVDIDGQGRIYFSSRFDQGEIQAGQRHGVYRIGSDGQVERLLASPQIDMPNGLVTSPDDTLLYLIDADGRDEGARRIRVYDLDGQGNVSNERLLYDFYPGRSGDGMCIDAEGNLYVAAGLHRRRGTSETLDTRPGIHVISPAGKLLAFLETPEDTLTNCRFGGADLRTLYIACGKLLLSVRTKIPGKASYRPAV